MTRSEEAALVDAIERTINRRMDEIVKRVIEAITEERPPVHRDALERIAEYEAQR